MPRPLRGFALALVCVWAILLIAAWFYSQDKNIPAHIAFAVVPAFLVEAALYLAAGMESTRRALERMRPWALAGWMTIAAPVPYSIYTAVLGLWSAQTAGILLLLAGVVAFWYVVLPKKSLAIDLVFLCMLAALELTEVFERLYPEPGIRIGIKVLGTAMLVRTGMLAVLSLRRMEGIGFGFVPRLRDWGWGVLCFVLLMPVALALGSWLGFMGTALRPFTPRLALVAVATFLGMLWVVALLEEFFFRGLLQQSLGKALKNQWAGLVIASIIFGLVHLPFRTFPNWRFAIVATIAGVFYGFAYMRAKSIRAAMVAHALTVTTWRVLLG